MINETDRHRTRRVVSIGFVAFLVLIGVAIAVTAVFYALRSPTTPYPFYPFFGFGWFFGLFFLFFLFWGFRWWMWGGGWGRRWRYGYGPWGSWGYGDSAHTILRERYARGEITKDQFEQMMRDLEQHS